MHAPASFLHRNLPVPYMDALFMCLVEQVCGGNLVIGKCTYKSIMKNAKCYKC